MRISVAQPWQITEGTPCSIQLRNMLSYISLENSLFGEAWEDLAVMRLEDILPEHHRGICVKNRDEYCSSPLMRPSRSGLDLQARRKDSGKFVVDVSQLPYKQRMGSWL